MENAGWLRMWSLHRWRSKARLPGQDAADKHALLSPRVWLRISRVRAVLSAMREVRPGAVRRGRAEASIKAIRAYLPNRVFIRAMEDDLFVRTACNAAIHHALLHTVGVVPHQVDTELHAEKLSARARSAKVLRREHVRGTRCRAHKAHKRLVRRDLRKLLGKRLPQIGQRCLHLVRRRHAPRARVRSSVRLRPGRYRRRGTPARAPAHLALRPVLTVRLRHFRKVEFVLLTVGRHEHDRRARSVSRQTALYVDHVGASVSVPISVLIIPFKVLLLLLLLWHVKERIAKVLLLLLLLWHVKERFAT